MAGPLPNKRLQQANPTRRFLLLSALGALVPFIGRVRAQRLAPADFLPEMNEAVEPLRIIGNIYYVGTNGVSSFLIATSRGHILLDSGFNQSVPIIRRSITRLGFRFEDIRLLLSSSRSLRSCRGPRANSGADRSTDCCERARRGRHRTWR